MKTGIGIFRLSLIFAGMTALFALLILWPNKASWFRNAPDQAVEEP